jgi:hypothetical protein
VLNSVSEILVGNNIQTTKPIDHTNNLCDNAVIQTVTECLTSSHTECSGLYTDQSSEFFVRCACRCHERGGLET